MVYLHQELTHEIIGAAIEVHRILGPGLLESVYEECLCHELTLRKIPHERQLMVTIDYKGLSIPKAYKLDVLVDHKVIVEIKAVVDMIPLFQAQLLTQLKLKNISVGLLINFNVPILKEGVTRLVL